LRCPLANVIMGIWLSWVYRSIDSRSPLFMTVTTRFALCRHAVFRLISQTRIHYAESPLSEGKAGEVEGGDRPPWVRTGADDNPLRSLDWQAHVYGEIEEAFETACSDLGLPVHVFGWFVQSGRQESEICNETYLRQIP
jgi:hypothetical protein